MKVGFYFWFTGTLISFLLSKRETTEYLSLIFAIGIYMYMYCENMSNKNEVHN